MTDPAHVAAVSAEVVPDALEPVPGDFWPAERPALSRQPAAATRAATRTHPRTSAGPR